MISDKEDTKPAEYSIDPGQSTNQTAEHSAPLEHSDDFYRAFADASEIAKTGHKIAELEKREPKEYSAWTNWDRDVEFLRAKMRDQNLAFEQKYSKSPKDVSEPAITPSTSKSRRQDPLHEYIEDAIKECCSDDDKRIMRYLREHAGKDGSIITRATEDGIIWTHPTLRKEKTLDLDALRNRLNRRKQRSNGR